MKVDWTFAGEVLGSPARRVRFAGLGRQTAPAALLGRLAALLGAPGALLGLMLGLALGFAAPARADLVLLADGSVIKVMRYELEGEKARLTLPSGGHMSLALARIDRVVDDEVVEFEGPPLPPPGERAGQTAVKPQIATMALRFEASQAIPGGPWGGLIYETARRHQVNPLVVAAVITAESAGNPRAVSRKGARGLMQLMPGTAARFGVTYDRLLDPAHNLEAGVKYLSTLVDLFPNDLARVLAAYNAGEQAVMRYGGVPPYRETRGYVREIFAHLGLPPADFATASGSTTVAHAGPAPALPGGGLQAPVAGIATVALGASR